ncbi:hypothetical protein AFL01nite_07210 [Aeromicrobium flavum]|uniref:DUF4190 domain-containing protein n=1 Tax=Aeromicrobium flavum TaxID=416568 RepID=A0A512HSG2_9ACTN|nr:DUF4190 domain-containing protein [Aeromicrobium flavum]GEO88394.1 hypothetical protein AFL01nite_07210 [Aeromicrobium flavum]
MSENQPPSYPGDPSGQQPNDPQPGPEQPTYPGQQQPYPGQQQPYGQQPYPGQQYPAGQGQPWGAPLPKHPKATLVLVLGIIGLVFCQVLGPFAWVIGGRAVKEIDANPGVWDGRGEAQAGRILGIIATVFLILSILALAFFITLIAIGVANSSDTSDYSELSLVSLF